MNRPPGRRKKKKRSSFVFGGRNGAGFVHRCETSLNKRAKRLNQYAQHAADTLLSVFTPSFQNYLSLEFVGFHAYPSAIGITDKVGKTVFTRRIMVMIFSGDEAGRASEATARARRNQNAKTGLHGSTSSWVDYAKVGGGSSISPGRTSCERSRKNGSTPCVASSSKRQAEGSWTQQQLRSVWEGRAA